MRIIFFLFMIFFFVLPVLAQEKPPTQAEIQAQMLEAINQLNIQIIELEKQLAEAKKNKEDAASIKNLEEQIANLKKQVKLMGGLKTNISGIPDKIIQQAGQKESLVPKRDVERIRMVSANILSDSGLYVYIKRIHAQVDKKIPAEERTAALQIYVETKTNYKSVIEINNAATGCWAYGHWEKAVWLSGKVCLDSIADPDMLNNYASFLTMIGAEHAALPILQYLNKKYPNNSTVLNNIGQAWFGLGEIPIAKKFLDSVTMIFPDHSLANLTLSTIYRSHGDSINAVATLRRSLRNSFTIEKAATLEGMGVELDDDDIDFDYPMEDEDPLGYEPFFDQFPPTPGNVGETPNALRQWEAFHEATALLNEKARHDADSANARTTVFINKMMDSSFNHPVLTLHNSNAYLKAGRKLPLAIKKKTALSIEEVMNMMAEAFHQTTSNRLNDLERQRRAAIAVAPLDCVQADAANNSFMSQAKAIIEEGGVAMRRVYLQNKRKVHNYIKLTAYSSLNDYNERMGKFHEEIWKKNSWIYVYTERFARTFSLLKKEPAMASSCDPAPEAPKQTKQLPSFKTPNCTYADSIKLIVGGIKEECNTCSIDESKLKFKKIEIEIGEVQISDASNSSAQGPQKQESVDPANTTSLGCNLSMPFKEGKGRPGKYKKCTVSSNRSNANGHGSHITTIGSRLTLAR